jgi:predicted DNA-binding protein YlxM (UPF0122 family)
MEDVRDYILQRFQQAKRENCDELDLLRRRINLLKGKDKLLMTMYLDNSNSFRQMGLLSGISETSIARRINRIMSRLIDGKYISCLRNSNQFTWKELAVAKEYFLLGCSMKKIAAKQRCSYYCVRRTIKKIRQRQAKDNLKEK